MHHIQLKLIIYLTKLINDNNVLTLFVHYGMLIYYYLLQK